MNKHVENFIFDESPHEINHHDFFSTQSESLIRSELYSPDVQDTTDF